MNWDELVTEFRELGGVADNVALAPGRFGRGVFPIDPRLPARVFAPESLLIPVDDVELRGSQLKVKSSTAVSPRAAALFENYQQSFGWGAGLFEELWETQQRWSELPEPVVQYITTMGTLEDPDRRFLPASAEVCLYLHVRTRSIKFHGKNYMMPVIDLVNHSSAAPGYVLENGPAVQGTFAGEMLVRYNLGDAWARVLCYSFAGAAQSANSIGITANVYGQQKVSIRRDVNDFDVRDNVQFPRTTLDANVLHLPYLMLGCSTGTDLPRGIFRKLVSANLTVSQADEAFDSIAHFNRTRFVNLLRILSDYDTPLVRTLRDAALNQLDALSYSIGARAL